MRIETTAGREHGHVPGHQYRDCDLSASGRTCTITITWGSARGYDEEHGREEYTRRGTDLADAIENCRDAALASQDDTDTECRRYIELAASRALQELSGAEG